MKSTRARRALAFLLYALVSWPVMATSPLPPGLQTAPVGPGVLLIARDLHGQTLWVDRAVDDLRSQGFNDSASHADVHGGAWEFCADGGYAGPCRVLGPGRHALPPELRNRLSSLRPVGGGGGGGDGARGDIVLYEHADFRGRQLALSRSERNLGDRGFNDTASAVHVLRGRWELCRHADFGGDCAVLGPGRHELRGPMNDEVSSVRPVSGGGTGGGGWGGGGGGSGGRGVTLLDGDTRRASEVRVDEAVANLRDLDFNDRADAVVVHGGRWELCTDARFRGQCVTFGPGRHRLPPALAGTVSSLRPR